MRLAIPYDNGQVFGHFGHAEAFRIYEIVDGEVIGRQLIEPEEGGHSALAALLEDYAIDAVICGGIGGGAVAALADRGIVVYSGISGEAEQAVADFLAGNLTPEGANCSHHEAQGEGGCHCGGSEEGGCHCGGGCHQPTLLFEGKNAGKVCRVHYRGTFNDGTQFDSSYDRGEPLEFVCAAGMMIPGFDRAVVDMEVGQILDIHLMPEEAYGPKDPDAIFTVPIAECAGSEDLTVGQQVYLQNAYGQPVPVMVAAKDETTVTFDANHEMAGKELNFRVELVEVRE